VRHPPLMRTQRQAYEAPCKFRAPRLGSVWGFVPHRPDHTHVRLNPPEPGPGESA